MKIPLSIAQKLAVLKQDIAMPYSKLKHPVIDLMIENGILIKQIQGRTKAVVHLHREVSLNAYLSNHYGIADLDTYISFLSLDDPTRAESVIANSDSKTRSIRTFKGFLINAVVPVECTLHGAPLLVSPHDGTFSFIYDYESFIPDELVTIVGIENPEVFRYIKNYSSLFTQEYKLEHLLFVSRYPQSHDLVKWLQSIPNNYLHFGDFDFAGLNIYQNEYKKLLHEKAKFFLPEGIEQMISLKGNRKNYDRQTIQFDINAVIEQEVHTLIAMIQKYKKGLEQEGLAVLSKPE